MYLGEIVTDSEGRQWLVWGLYYGQHYELVLVPEGESFESYGQTWFPQEREQKLIPWGQTIQ